MFGTLTEFKQFLDLSEVTSYDVLLSSILESANGWLTSLSGQPLYFIEGDEVRADGTGSDYLVLNRFPLKQVNVIAAYSGETWDTYDLSADYFAFSSYGELRHSDGFPKGFQNILVNFDSGFEPTDPEYTTVKWMVYEIGSVIFRNRGTLNLLSTDQGVQITRLDGFLSPEVRVLLDKYTIRGD